MPNVAHQFAASRQDRVSEVLENRRAKELRDYDSFGISRGKACCLLLLR